MPYRTKEKMGIREGRDVRREVRLVIGVIRVLGVLGGGRGEMARKFGTQNFVEMNAENLNK